METRTPVDTIARNRLFHGLGRDHIENLSSCAAEETLRSNAVVFEQGAPAERCYLILKGRVSVEVTSPQGRAVTIQTLGAGEVLGWSWLFPPYRWHFDARALELTEVLVLSGPCVRERCERDPKLGYEVMKRVAAMMHERMQAARLQIIDLYGPTSA